MAWTNYHSHTNYCDGDADPEIYILAAIEEGLLAYGFSSHAPVPFDCKWTMNKQRIGDYSRYIDFLQHKYRDKIEIYKSLEIDYIPGVIGVSHPSIQKLNLDYSIGSIHFIDKFPDGMPWEIDGNHWKFATGLLEIFQGDIKRVITRYYQLTREMVQKDCPDIIGHLDKIKIQNSFFEYFDETESWYKREIEQTLSTIAQSDAIVEVNTRGLYKRKTNSTYPSPWILERIHDLNIPVTINSDSHRPEEITMGFEETAKLLDDIGFKRVRAFVNGYWQDFDLNRNGLAIPVAV